jgi:hypothetical protein
MAINPAVTDISALTVGQFVVEVTDFGIPGGIRQFATRESGAYVPINGTALPSVAYVAAVTITDAPGGPQKIGSYKVTLQAGTGDSISATSPLVLTLTPNAQVLTNATAN